MSADTDNFRMTGISRNQGYCSPTRMLLHNTMDFRNKRTSGVKHMQWLLPDARHHVLSNPMRPYHKRCVLRRFFGRFYNPHAAASQLPNHLRVMDNRSERTHGLILFQQRHDRVNRTLYSKAKPRRFCNPYLSQYSSSPLSPQQALYKGDPLS